MYVKYIEKEWTKKWTWNHVERDQYDRNDYDYVTSFDKHKVGGCFWLRAP